MNLTNQTINADIVDATLTLELAGEIIVESTVSKIIVARLRFLGGVKISLKCQGLLIKAGIFQGRAAVTWDGAGSAKASRLQRASDGAPGSNATPLAQSDFGKKGNPGGEGHSGADGLVGQNGEDAPSLRIVYRETTSFGHLFIDLRGQHGQSGQDGGHGGDGGNGGVGGLAQLDSTGAGYTFPQGRGGNAGDAGNGGNAGSGGNGGSGGYLLIQLATDILPNPPQHPIMIVAETAAGNAGRPGIPGRPGTPGSPGLGAPALGPCKIDEWVLSGQPGKDGVVGKSAEPGSAGGAPSPTISFISIADYNAIN